MYQPYQRCIGCAYLTPIEDKDERNNDFEELTNIGKFIQHFFFYIYFDD